MSNPMRPVVHQKTLFTLAIPIDVNLWDDKYNQHGHHDIDKKADKNSKNAWSQFYGKY
jgi:hypothetical protein